MNINSLNSFIVISKHLNYSKAAEELYLSQPALTKQIKELEKELGCILLDRTTRTMRLTPCGEQCLKYAKQIVNSKNNMESEIGRINQSKIDTLRIGYVTPAHVSYIERGLKAIHKKYPLAVIDIIKDTPIELVHKLRTGELDCAFLHLPSVKNRGFSYKTIHKGGAVIRIPEQSHLIHKEILTIDDIKEFPIVTAKIISPRSFAFILECYKKYDVVPEIIHSNSQESIEILMNTRNAISFTSELSPAIPGYVNIKVVGFEDGFDLVLAKEKACTSTLVDQFYKFIAIYNH